MFTVVLCHTHHHQELSKGADRFVHVEGDSGEGGSASCDSAGLVKHNTLYLEEGSAILVFVSEDI